MSKATLRAKEAACETPEELISKFGLLDYTFEFSQFGIYPLVSVAPAIEWESDLIIKEEVKSGMGTILFIDGNIEGREFPAFESFITDENGVNVFLHTFTSPDEHFLALELSNPIYDYNAYIELYIVGCRR